MRESPWSVLGIAPTDDRREVKRAYSRLLKAIDVDADPAAFIRLRDAMETALAWGTSFPWYPQDEGEAEAEAEAEAEEEATGLENGEAYGESGEEDYEPWPGWARPAAPAAGDLGRLAAELEAALGGQAEAEPERVAALGRAILGDPELAHVDRAREAEQWLASLIADSFPRSDPLVPLAIGHFGWDKGGSIGRDWSVQTILQRREDLKFLRSIHNGHPHRRALEELQGPPRERLGLFQLHFAADVRVFLAVVDARETLIHDLNPESVAWWRGYFEEPHLPPSFWILWGAGSLLLTLLGAALFASAGAAFGAVAAGAMLITFGAIYGWSRLRAAQRAQAAASVYDEDRPRGAERWAAGALLLAAAAALLPPHWASAAAVSAAALCIGWGAFRRSWTEPEWLGASPRPRIFLPCVAAIVAVFAAFAMAPLRAATIALPLATLCWAGSQCFRPVEAWLLKAGRSVRLRLLAGALALVACAMAAAAAALLNWLPPAILLVLPPIAIVAAHLASAASAVDVHIVEWPLRVIVAVGYFAGKAFIPDGFTAVAFAASAAYGLGYAFARLAMALREEVKAPAVAEA